ncbi:hypothetical protein NITUZ_40387 [Candidatus Nitrosotenuis uzonensis]|uniref:C2H2-type domain-containing protein n=2 Tax=Candidatus Nitrosotenuis uzonensis TaxID=1407055 RepID=V6AU20_9ARCH|nr:hypothetical protein NITUZ_40387 [Candidatus Nitrosotenuis uzonensis]
MLLRCESPWEAVVLASFKDYKEDLLICIMPTCTVCGQQIANDILFLNHMMEKHGFRNPNVGTPDRNSRGY